MRHPSWLAPTPPTVAIEIASRRITVAGVAHAAGRPVVSTTATEALAPGLVAPALSGANITDPTAVADALRRVLERAGLRSARRAALVVPDGVARVSLLQFDEVPARPSDRDQLIRWQVRKATPFPIEQAQVSDFTASTNGAAQSIAAIVARRDVVLQYESVAAAVGIHAGLVDLASFSVMNLVIGQSARVAGDWLLVHIVPEGTTLAILRGAELMFYRYRTAADEPLRSLVHQTAMYHEDRLGGGAFARVLLAGAGADAPDVRREIGDRLKAPAEVVDVHAAADLSDRVSAAGGDFDALAAPIGVLIRERKAA